MSTNAALLVLAALLIATCAYADPVDMKFTGVNGANDFGYYIGPYYGSLNGSPVTLYCEDFAHEVNFGQTWTANLTPITPDSNLQFARFGNVPAAISLYEQAAWLTTQYASQPQNNWGDIQAAIWQIFDPSGSPQSSGAPQWRTLAAANFEKLDYSQFELVTNTGLNDSTATQVQEFITIPPPGTVAAQTPEPGTSILIGAGLMVVAAVGIRRVNRRRAAAQPQTLS